MTKLTTTTAREIGAKGGKAAWAKVSKKKRTEQMRALAEKRWKKTI